MKTTLRNYLLFFFLLVYFQSFAVNYYVSSNGSDGNSGTSATSPFKTIQKAANLTNPGDVVYVMNGTYTNSCSVCDGINITRSGTSTAWIKYTNYPGHTPKIKFNSWQGVKVFGASYVEISGFEIEGNNRSINLAYAQSESGNVNNPLTSGNGIYIENNGSTFPHHIKITNNKIHDCGGHGVGSHWADYITIENNHIYNNAWYSPLGCSGISLYQNRNFDSFSGYRIRIAGNVIYNNQMFIPFFYNKKIEDGNGMIIDDARNTQNGSTQGRYTGSIRVENNVVFDNGGKGIHAYYSDNMDAVNNTCYQNCKSPEVKDGELSAYACSNVRFYNNATYSRSDARANHDGDGSSSNVVFNYNIYYNFSTTKKITKGTNDIVADPKFVNASVNPALANFRLQAGSPGINKGTSTLAPAVDIENKSRPSGAVYDIGAYEYSSSTPSNIPPVANITAPLTNASYIAGSTITINATATDSDGSVTKVEFFQGAVKLGEDLTSPYSFTWTNVAAGNYSLTVKATDNGMAVATSSAVLITVAPANALPAVSITSPLNNTSYRAGTAITINANASDADGTISKVEFFQGTVKLGEDLTSPYTFSWANVAAGTYTLTAKATDNRSGVTTSAGVVITVTPANAAPVISINSPAAGSGFRTGSTISIAANATDADGTITKVEFFQGTVKLGEDLTSPYSFSWVNVPAGNYILTAKATDNGSLTTTSAPVSISVANTPANTAPTVGLTSPLNNASVAAGSTVTINANAADSDGTISKVEFFQGTVKLGEDFTSPYSFSWVNVPAGIYTLTVKATDNGALTATSASITIQVTTVSTGNCVSKTIPSASNWVLRNNWSDQNNGSGLSNNTESLVITHRAWGNNTVWIIENAPTYNLIAGKEYTISFDYKDDAVNKLVSLETGFARSYDGSGVTLIQPAGLVPSGFSSTAFTSKSVKFTPTVSGAAYLVFKLNWSGQPNQQVKNYIKNLKVCEPTGTIRFADFADHQSSASIFPNPIEDFGILRINSLGEETILLEVFDVSGIKVSEKVEDPTKDIIVGNDLRAGVYFIQATFGDKREVYKFIKK